MVRIRKLASFFLLSAFVIIMAICSCGSSYGVKINHSGQATLEVFVQTEETKREFEKRVEKKVEGYCKIISDDDAIEIKSIDSTPDGFCVKVSTRRIDKLAGFGVADYDDASEYFLAESEKNRKLESWENGNLRTLVPTAIEGGYFGAIRIESGEGYPIQAKVAADDRVVSVEQLTQNENMSGKKIVTFAFLDIEGVTEISVTIPGKILYYAGAGELIEKDTVRYETTDVSVVTETPNEDGDPIVERKTANSVFGYVIYEPSMSPFAIAIIVIICLLIVGGVALTLVYLYKRGKKIATEENCHE